MPKLVKTSVLLFLFVYAASNTVARLEAQSDTTLTLNSGQTPRGKIKTTSPEKIVLETSRGEQEYAVGEIRQVRLAGEPNWLNSAKARFRENRYDACYDLIHAESLDALEPILQQEATFYLAMSAAKLALGDGEVTANQAGNLLLSFINKFPDSFNSYSAIEAFADLALENGGFARAAEYYEKLEGVQSAEFKQRAQLNLGKAKLHEGKYAEAAETLNRAAGLPTSDSISQLIAGCFHAQAISYLGRADEAIEILQNLIKSENSSQSELFAHIYNALGVAYLNKNDLKAARTAFMHTDLLFFTNRNAHAEALFHLHKIANDLQDSERSAKTRQLLKSRYRSTHWASKL
ncbi:MAG TPA: tetratricopeptide repeat protein [Pirellulaceae bacterium]|nr:tetratricopeptide repeat protein [Pirellulaceae bacterium]HMO91261.1 tetratricopeptide repeat protein [Pirellulaceae bacterium]HMP68555.1 tetratricopeptide repeat protein [Pirellulaceae bacterium]